MAQFKILVDFDAEDVYVKKVKIVGGFEMPSLEMSDLLKDVRDELAQIGSDSFEKYCKSIKGGK